MKTLAMPLIGDIFDILQKATSRPKGREKTRVRTNISTVCPKPSVICTIIEENGIEIIPFS